MVNSVTLDRFAVGLPDPQGHKSEIIATCACGCGEEIEAGYEYIEADGEWFVDTTCFLKYYSAEWRIAGIW